MTLLSPRRVLACAAVTAAALLAAPAQAAPTQTFVVTLAPGSSPDAVAALASKLGSVTHVYRHALRGFAVQLPAPVLPRLLRLPGVAAVEVDQVMRGTGTQTPTPSYGLDRIDARSGLDGRWTYGATGAGVTAYVIDSGINPVHTDFGRRATRGFDAISPSTGGADCHGHGTHVAGTLGGSRYGVAKGVKIVAVRVLNCDNSGNTSGVIAGIDWVAQRAARPSVANISIGGGASPALDRAVNGLISRGVTVGVAAGNGGGLVSDLFGLEDACSFSPSRVPAALTVAATDSNDLRAFYSNRGPCVDLWAPGDGITSAWIGGPNESNTISGTSMATPHVVGVAALYLSTRRNHSPAQVAAALTAEATPDKVVNAGDSPNRLLYSRY